MTSEGSLFDAHPAAFGRYPVLHQIGAGSMGPVFQAEDPDSQAPVAVKALTGLPPDRVRAVARALAELVAADLDLPAAARALAAGVQAPDPYIVTTFCPGQSLDVALREYGPAAILDALPRLELVAGVLDDAAAEGVWHGGLQPRDILVSADETLLAGLGIAQAVERAGVRLPVRQPYTAPEVAEGGATSPAADQFALAAIAYEWLFGRRVAGPAGDGFEAPVLPGVAADALNGAFASALAPEPGERFMSCRAFVEALSAAVEDPETARPAARGRKSKARVAPAPLPLDLGQDAGGPAILPDPPIVELEPVDVADALRLQEEIASPIDTPPETSGPVAWDDEPEEPADDLALAEPEPEEAPGLASPPPGWDAAGAARGDGFGWGAVVVTLALGVVLGAAVMYFAAGRGVAPSVESGVVAPDGGTPAAAPTGSGDATQGPVTVTEAPAVPEQPEEAAPPEAAPAPSPVAAAPAAPAPAARPGRLLVRTTPAGAAVTIDGEAAGETPLTLRDLPLGTRTVRVSRAGFDPIERRVSLTAARPSRSLELRLAAERPASPPPARPRAAAPVTPGITTGSVVVESRPAGATVIVNGRARGATPLTLDGLAPGRYTVRIERPGYRPWQTTVEVTAGGRARVAASLQGGQAEE